MLCSPLVFEATAPVGEPSVAVLAGVGFGARVSEGVLLQIVDDIERLATGAGSNNCRCNTQIHLRNVKYSLLRGMSMTPIVHKINNLQVKGLSPVWRC